MQGKIAGQNCRAKLQDKIEGQNCRIKVEGKITKIARINFGKNCTGKLQSRITGQNCRAKLQGKIAWKNLREKLQRIIYMQNLRAKLQSRIAEQPCCAKWRNKVLWQNCRTKSHVEMDLYLRKIPTNCGMFGWIQWVERTENSSWISSKFSSCHRFNNHFTSVIYCGRIVSKLVSKTLFSYSKLCKVDTAIPANGLYY